MYFMNKTGYRCIIIVFMLSLIPVNSLYPQVSKKNAQIGIATRLTVDLLYAKNHTMWFNWRIAISGSGIYPIQLSTDKYYQPSLHLDAVIMKGGIGTNDVDALRNHKISSRKANGFLIATIIPFQFGYSEIDQESNNSSLKGKPLYYFSDFTFPSLVNSYKSSVSLGSSFSYNMHSRKMQRISDFNVSFRNLTVQYLNDGPPFSLNGLLGDKKDRWFTGAGIINYFNADWYLNNLELAYHKFTGWNDNSYETSVALGLTEVCYQDNQEYKFSTSLFSLRALHANTTANSSESVRFTNSRSSFTGGFGINIYDEYFMDFQHLIHFKKYYAHHISPNPPKWGATVYGQMLMLSK